MNRAPFQQGLILYTQGTQISTGSNIKTFNKGLNRQRVQYYFFFFLFVKFYLRQPFFSLIVNPSHRRNDGTNHHHTTKDQIVNSEVQ